MDKVQSPTPIDDSLKSLGLTKLKSLPMPSLHGKQIIEPSEIEIQRIIHLAKARRLSEIPKQHEDWLCYRLMPSIVRYGTYPPPHERESKPANDKMFATFLSRIARLKSFFLRYLPVQNSMIKVSRL